MGKLLSCCIRCFPERGDEPNPNEEMSLLAQPPVLSYTQEQPVEPASNSPAESSFAANLDEQLIEAKDHFLSLLSEDYPTDGECHAHETDSGVFLHYRWTAESPLPHISSVLQNFSGRKDWDESVVLCEIAGSLGETTVVYMQFQQSLMHAGRDVLAAVRKFALADGKECVVSKSTTSPEYPLKVNVIRTNLRVAGFHLSPSGDHTLIDYLAEIQVSKAIPRDEVVRLHSESIRSFALSLGEHTAHSK